MYLARVISKPTYISCPCLVGSVNSMGAKSGEVATVRTPGVTVLISAAAAVVSAAASVPAAAVVSAVAAVVAVFAEVLPQPTSREAISSTARIMDTVFFIFHSLLCGSFD